MIVKIKKNTMRPELAIFAFIRLGRIIMPTEYVWKRKECTPFTRISGKDGHVALRCAEDIHCPKGSRCYISLENPELIGVCVVTYDGKFVLSKVDKIWDTDTK